MKTLSSTDPEDRQKFADETELMKTFSHRHIVSLLGESDCQLQYTVCVCVCVSVYVCVSVSLTFQTGTCHEEEDGAPMIILELMPYGDLKDFLIKQK